MAAASQSPHLPDRLVLICHQLRSPENLGAIARVMANFGATELILSDPLTHDFRGADKTAVKGEGVLETFAVARDLDEALAKTVYAIGTTSRELIKRRTPVTPEEGIARLAEHAQRGRVALVLGGEKRGLSDDELARCHDIMVIPTPGPQPSMNLSHAAAVLLYLWARQTSGQAVTAEPLGAPLATVKALEGKMEEALLACQFLNPQAPQHVLGELTRSLIRNGLTRREAEIWLSAFEHVRRSRE